MVNYVKIDTGAEQDEQNICKEVVENHKDEVDELLKVQEEEGKEAWRLLVESPNRVRATQIRVGKQSEIDNDDIEEAIDDYDFVGVESIIFIHTHPSAGFLSPNDIAAHARFVGRFDAYQATLGAFMDGGVVDVFGVENEGEVTINEQAEVNKKMDKFQNMMEEADSPKVFYEIVGDLFDEMDEFVDFCKESYRQ